MGSPDINYLDIPKPTKWLEKPNNSGELTVINANSNSESDLYFCYEHNVSFKVELTVASDKNYQKRRSSIVGVS